MQYMIEILLKFYPAVFVLTWVQIAICKIGYYDIKLEN